MKLNGLLIRQIIGDGLMVSSLVAACHIEKIFSQPFTSLTILSISFTLVLMPTFWIGLLLEESGRRKRRNK